MDSTAEILAELDEQQREVASTLDGQVVVVAGAGTGKTRAMTHRIAYGVSVGRFDPVKTLAVTFTTRAAGELRSRLARLGVGQVQARTFHSAALRQAQYFWPKAYGSPLPAVEERRMPLVADAAKRHGLKVETALLRDLVGEISWAKVSNVAPDTYVELAEGRDVSGVTPAQLAGVYASYEDLKAQRGIIDFDDILLCTAGLLADHPDVVAAVRGAYRHFVVDEYQDVSPLQEALLRLWCGDNPDLCVVGDPAQTIHSFAGARSQYLRHFTRTYPGARRIELTRNYRSTPEILTLANSVIGPEGLQLQAHQGSGPTPTFVPATHEAAESASVAAWLRSCHDAGTEWAEMACLFRINAQSPALESALTDAKIPYVVKGAEKFYDRAEVKQALSLIRGADAQGDPLQVMEQLFSRLGWSPEAPSGAGAQRERWESLAALLDVARETVARVAESGRQAELADVVADLEERALSQHAPTASGVTLATFHSAKGLEWNAVALVGLHEGMMPFSLADTPTKVAEERRLLYVGTTRAKRHLRLSWSQGRTEAGGQRKPSRFLPVASVPESAAPTRRRARSTVLKSTCRVCSKLLGDAAERKLGRHLDCPSSYDEDLLARLKEWRLEVAREQGVPAYCVFTDVTLLSIAETTPSSPQDLVGIAGVGAVKRERYGEAVIQIVNNCDK